MSNTLQTGRPKPARCPKCGSENNLELNECASCGIIFERYKATSPAEKGAPRQQPATPSARRRYAPLDLMAMGGYAHFFRRLGRMVDAGMSLPQAARAAVGSGQAGQLVRKLLPHLEAGYSLVRAMDMEQVRFPSYVWGHLAAGELAGRLSENLDRLATEIEERRSRILAQIFNWRMLWFFVMLFFGAGSLAITGAVGRVAENSGGKGTAEVLLAIALGAGPWFFVYLGSFLLLCLGFGWFQIKGKYYLSARFPAFETFRLWLPLTGSILIHETLSRYLQLLADLLRAGLPLYQALDLAREDIELCQWRGQFEVIRKTVEAGGTLSAGFARVPRLSPDLIAEVSVGEKTGELATGLDHFTARLKDTLQNKRTTWNVITAAALFAIGIILTLIVTIRGLGSIVGIYDKI